MKKFTKKLESIKPFTNVDRLDKLDALGGVRKSMGTSSEEDTYMDGVINKLNLDSLVDKWAVYRGVEPGIWYELKELYDGLQQL